MAAYEQAGLEADCDGNLYAVNQVTARSWSFPSGEIGFCSFTRHPWLDETPKSGSARASATQPVTLDFITALQWPGLHQADAPRRRHRPVRAVDVPVNYTIAFLDVPVDPLGRRAHPRARRRSRLASAAAGATSAPTSTIDRAEMAVLMVRAMHGPLYAPPAATGIFIDVPSTTPTTPPTTSSSSTATASSPAAGRSPLRYCPNDLVNRAQMSVFVAKGLGLPTAPATGFFTDVSGTIYAGFAPYAEALYNNGITAGCGDHIFCPATQITRNQLAVWLVKALGLPMAPPTP